MIFHGFSRFTTPKLIITGRFNLFEVVITNYITVTVAGLFFFEEAKIDNSYSYRPFPSEGSIRIS